MNDADREILSNPDFWIFALVLVLMLISFGGIIASKLRSVVGGNQGGSGGPFLGGSPLVDIPILLIWGVWKLLIFITGGLSLIAGWAMRPPEQASDPVRNEGSFFGDWLSPPNQGAMSWRSLVRHVNNQPQQLPHTAIIGPTGSGKTTLALALAGERRDHTIVITSKAAADDWRGASVYSLDTDGSYTSIIAAMAALENERRTRIVDLRAGRALQPLTIILDETSDLVHHVKTTGDLIASIASLGREIRMRLLVINTSERVKNWGLQGRGDLLDSFVVIHTDQKRSARLLLDGNQEQPINMSGVVGRARAARLAPFDIACNSPAPDERSDTTGKSIAYVGDTDDTGIAGIGGIGGIDALIERYQLTDDTSRMILAGIAMGMSNNQISGNLKKNRNDAMKQIARIRAHYEEWIDV